MTKEKAASMALVTRSTAAVIDTADMAFCRSDETQK
jgi:hypothetical protein